MRSGQFIETASRSLSQVLSGSDRYIVPRFQRDYSWTKQEWEDLLDDIDDVVGTEEHHFFGHVVLCPDGREKSAIIDGQQRLTTVLLITLAAAMKFEQTPCDGEEREANMQRVKYCQERMQIMDLSGSKKSTRIQLSHRNSTYFNKLVSELKLTEPDAFPTTNRKILAALRFFRNEFKEMNCEKVVKFLEDMYGLLNLSVITVSNLNSAFTVFESLNHKGSRLQVADLVKNLIMSQMIPPDSAKKDSEDIMRIIDDDWDEVLLTVTESEISKYLRSLEMLTSDGNLINMKKLYKHIEGRCKPQPAAEDYLNDIKHFAAPYKAIRGMSSAPWIHHARNSNNLAQDSKDFSNTLPVMDALKLFDVRLPISLLLAAAETLSVHDFELLADAVLAVTIRFGVIGNNPLKPLEKHYAELIPDLMKRKVGVAKIINSFVEKNFYPSDNDFKLKFKGYEIKQTDKAAYFLREIEKSCNDIPDAELGAGKISELERFRKDENGGMSDPLEEIKDGIGNHYLFEKISKGRNNVRQADKAVQNLLSEDFEVNRQVAGCKVWNLENYYEHQSWLADKAVEIWVIPDVS